MKATVLSLAVLCVAAATTVEAQTSCNGGRGYRAAPYYGPFWYRPLTVAESYARGRADLTRSRGLYNLLTSQAMINAAEAHRRELENDVLRTETFFKKREINQQALAAQREARRRNRPPADHALASRTQHRDPVVVDGRTGDILWPALLEEADYADGRAAVENILTSKTIAGGITPEDRQRLDRAVGGMLAQLRDHVREVPPSEYVEAKNFLEALGSGKQSQAI